MSKIVQGEVLSSAIHSSMPVTALGPRPYAMPLHEPIIESSKSIDIGIYYGLSFLWNAESTKNLQQTKAEKVGNSESTGDSDKFPDAP